MTHGYVSVDGKKHCQPGVDGTHWVGDGKHWTVRHLNEVLVVIALVEQSSEWTEQQVADED